MKARGAARIVFLTAASGEGIRGAPFGAGRVASALKADPALADRVSCVILEAAPAEAPRALAERALALEPDIVGLSLYVWNRARLLEAAGVVKSARPGVLVVAGGPEASGAPDALSADSRVDLVVCGEGESAMRAIVSALADKRELPGPIVRMAVSDLSSIASPWLDGTLDPARYGGAPLELARGCPFRCAFCFESKGESTVRHFPLERVGMELEAFAAAGVSEVFVLDPTFNADRARMAGAIKLMRERGPGLRYFVELRAELLDREQARLLASVDCAAQIGLQSSDPAVLALVDRRFDEATFARKVALLDEAGVTYGLDLIYGLPGDSPAGFMRSVDYALSLGPNHLDVFRLAVLPGTALAERAAALGLDFDRGAPYLVRSTHSFGRADLDRAESAALSLDLLYNKGRAVMWFRAVAKALGGRPSALLAAWEAFIGAEPAAAGESAPKNHAVIESLQRRFIAGRFAAAGKRAPRAAEAADQLIQASGAWTRALSDGEASRLALSWHPEALLDYAPADLRRFADEFPRESGVWTCEPGRSGPEFRPTGRRRP